MKTIVVGYDDTEAARRALVRAADIAETFGAKLVVASVAPLLAGVARSAGPLDPADSLEKHHAELARAQERLAGRELDADFLPAVGEPADMIVELAEQHGADMIVVGTREPSILERLLGQSVSGSVARQAHCDVLIVH